MTEMPLNRCNAKHNLISTTPSPTKLCHIVKNSDFEGYGFSLHSEKVKPGQYIGKVDHNSPAESAGLKEGDRVIEVNGVNIIQESHKQVVQRIKSISHEVRLLIENTLGDHTDLESRAAGITKINNSSREVGGIRQEIPLSSKNAINSCMKGTEHSSKEVVIGQPNKKNPLQTLPHLWSPNGDKFIQNISKISKPGSSSRSLELPITAAEMRARLLLKKKYDPKNENVDLKTKFDIIEKL